MHPWNIRLQIALGTAEGLAYLHIGLEFQVMYWDFKASNVLLDREFKPKLSDFGLAREGPSDGRSHVSTAQIAPRLLGAQTNALEEGRIPDTTESTKESRRTNSCKTASCSQLKLGGGAKEDFQNSSGATHELRRWNDRSPLRIRTREEAIVKTMELKKVPEETLRKIHGAKNFQSYFLVFSFVPYFRSFSQIKLKS